MKVLITALSVVLTAGPGYAEVYHVSSTGLDGNPGTEAKPFKTISAAASVAGPGDTITVHEGVYRERINPPRGGSSDRKRIVYQAAKDDRVVIKGSEIVKGWKKLRNDTWQVSIPNSLFGEFNPFNNLIRGDWFNRKDRDHHTGAVYLNGHWLTEAAKHEDVLQAEEDDPLWFAALDDKNTTIWAQFKGVDPNKEEVEINVRQSVFYPEEPGKNYISVRGFTLEQAGIVGSLGAIFSTVSDNSIHDIHVRRLFGGHEMAGIKFHGAVDTLISNNHIYRTNRGIWLDWMSQGTRVTGNLLHDNGPLEDIFVEVNHGPFVVDNNLLLSPMSLQVNSQGCAYAHNLITGRVQVRTGEGRLTPFLEEHGTAIAGLADNPGGDERYYNNLIVNGGLAEYDPVKLPMFLGGNVYVNGAKPSKHESDPLVLPNIDPEIQLVEKIDGFYLQIDHDEAWTQQERCLVTTEVLGKAKTPDLPYLNYNGAALKIDRDYFGNKRNTKNHCAGPFNEPKEGRQSIKVWPKR
jgi:hypothetical protein